MGKLTIHVHGCKIHQPCARVDISPRVVVVVDNTYRFRTGVRKRTFEPKYEDNFIVGNTHRFAVIEISVYDVVEQKNSLLQGLRLEGTRGGNFAGGAERGSGQRRSRSLSREKKGGGLLGGKDKDGGSSASPASPDFGDMGDDSSEEANLLGRCYISIERFVRGQPKTRTYLLGTPVGHRGSRDEVAPMPAGVAGTVRITLSSDGLGESPSTLRIDDTMEGQCMERLVRFFLHTDKAKIQVLDLILSNLRERSERLKEASRHASPTDNSALPDPPLSEQQQRGGAGGQQSKTALTHTTVTVNKMFPELTFHRPHHHETSDELLSRLCTEYDSFESKAFHVKVRVDGCTNLDKKALNKAFLGSDGVYAIFRTESEDYITREAKLQSTVVWTEGNEAILDVANPATFVVHVVVMGRSSQKHYEIGRTSVGVATLALEQVSERHLYLCTFDSVTLPLVTGAVHLSLKPVNFGLCSVEQSAEADDYYERLSRFFQRYDVVRVPQVDSLIRARVGALDVFMRDLIIEHGREPGSVKLDVTIEEIVALQEVMDSELNDKEVRVVITMGDTAVQTKARKISRFVTAKFDEGFCFDVVRETDLIRLEVVRASDASVVYGCVDITCLNIQRGLTNHRKVYLVGNAGTAEAYISGIIKFSLYSDEVGKNYAVDEEQERVFYDRLRRYAFRRLPESLHRVCLAVDMVFDMETFMAQIASRYGEEDPTLAVYFTVIGCRQLRSRFGGVSPYVVVRVGIDSYHTKYVKDNPEADFFEFCEFYIDRLSDHYITLIVMDHFDVGDDAEIGRAVISLRDVTIGQQYHDFLPLLPPSSKKRVPKPQKGRIGAKGKEESLSARSGGNDADTSANDDSESVGRGAASRRSDNRLFSPTEARSPGSVNPAHGDMSTADYYYHNANECADEAKQKALGSVGFKYVVTDMKLVDTTRRRLTQQQMRRENAAIAPYLRMYDGCDATDAHQAGLRDTNSLRAPSQSLADRGNVDGCGGGGGGGSVSGGISRANSGLTEDQHPPPGAATGAKQAKSAPRLGGIGNSAVGGWRSKLKSVQRSLAARHATGGEGSGGGGGGGAPHDNNKKNADAGSVTQVPLSGDATSEGVSSARSTACVPTVNLMDQGIMDLDAFLSAPILSNINSASNSAADEDDEGHSDDDGGGSYHSEHPGLPGINAIAGGMRSESAIGTAGGRNMRGAPIRDAGRRQPANPLAGGRSSHVVPSNHDDGTEEDNLDQLLAHTNTMSSMYDGPPGSDEGGSDGADSATRDNGPKCLRLRILFCKNLYCPTKQRPNPYLLFSTMGETHRTRIEFDTVSPRYNEEFHIRIDDPQGDYMQMSVLTDTPYGSKKLGHCVLSLRNVQRGEWHTRWAALVVNSHHASAFEQGSVCFSMMGDNFGLECLPSTDAENRLRERLRDFLVSTEPSQLHRLEWFVGAYADRESNVLAQLFGKYYISSDATQSADLTVEVKQVRQLCIDDAMLFSGSCVVKIKANGKTYAKTRSVTGTDGLFIFNETLGFHLDNPGTAQLRFCVFANGKVKAGESLATLQDLHKGVAQERTHVLSIDARGAHPVPSGFITCSLLSPTFGSSSTPPTDEEAERFYRLQRFLYYYLPDEVAMTDLRFSTTPNMKAYLRQLTRKHGPEPGEYHLRVQVLRCMNMHFVSDATLHSFAVIRYGMMTEQRTAIVEGHRECVFHESFDLTVGLPARDKVEIILFNFGAAKCREIGRTQLPLKTIVRGQNNDMRLPLVRNAGTRFAEVNGFVELEVYTDDFGQTNTRTQSSMWFYPEDSAGNPMATTTSGGSFGGSPATTTATTGSGKKTKQLQSGSHSEGSRLAGGGSSLSNFFSRNRRSQQTLADADAAPHSHAADGGSGSSSTLPSPDGQRLSSARTGSPATAASQSTSVTVRPKPSDTSVMVRIIITGFLGLKVRDVELYIRVTCKNKQLARTKPIPMSELATLQEPVIFDTDDLALFTDRVFTLKLGQSLLLSKEAVCYADFCLAQCRPGAVTEKRLRLYECKTNDFIGICRLNIDVPADASSFALSPRQTTDSEAPSIATVETVLDDMASLVAKYSPKDLRRLDLSFFRSTDIRKVHRSFRLQLCPTTVSTVYVVIHDVKLNLTTTPTSFVFKHACTVSATCGDYTTEVMKRTAITASNASPTIFPFGMSRSGVSGLDFCPLRVDITPTGPDAVMMLCVNDRQSKTKVTEVGRTVVSLRALLSHQVYDMGEHVTVPLVEQRRGSNRANASLLGSITFSLYPPAYETYPSSLRFPSRDLSNFSREYMRYYTLRTYLLLKNYDANSLVDLHAQMYEKFVPGRAWERGLPEFLSSLVERWGPELEPAGPVPPL